MILGLSIQIKEIFHSRIIIIHILNMCRNNMFVKQVLERKRLFGALNTPVSSIFLWLT